MWRKGIRGAPLILVCAGRFPPDWCSIFAELLSGKLGLYTNEYASVRSDFYPGPFEVRLVSPWRGPGSRIPASGSGKRNKMLASHHFL